MRVGDYFAVGDGNADDTAAIQNALNEVQSGIPVVLPAGTYNIASGPLNIPTNGTRLVGAGRATTILTTSTPGQDLITFPAGINKVTIQSLTLSNTSVAGHIFAPAGSCNTLNMYDCQMVQNNPAKSIWNHGDAGYIDNLWLGCVLTHNGATSVPTINIVTNSTGANSNTWMRCQCNHVAAGTATFFNIERDNAAAYNYNNTFRDLTFEVCNGGCITLLSANSCLIDNCNVYDVTTSTASLFVIGAGTGGQASRSNTIRGMHRISGALGGGLFDIALQTGGKAIATTIQDCNQSSGAGLTIDLGTNQRSLLLGAENATISNKHQSTILLDRGRFVGETVQLFTKAGAILDTDFNVTPADGSMAVNTTLPGIAVRIGGVWKQSTLA